MKRSYVKPELAYESFELSQSIAACAVTLAHAAVETCALNADNPGFEFMAGYFAAPGVCTIVETSAEIYCYTNGAEALLPLQAS